jgi:3-hydroxyisobutyrate dehydrogenase
MQPRIGFIGLGIMGKPMALNLIKAGYSLTVHSRSRPPVDAVAAAGAAVADSPRAVAEQADVVVTMVPDTPDVEAVLLGANGVIEAARAGLTVVDMSTISPQVTREIAARLKEKGTDMLDAPVSGGEPGAQAGTLSIMVGGDQEVFERCRPLFEVMGQKITYGGANGMGQTIKLCNQIICGLNLVAMGEGLVFAQRMGADLPTMIEAVSAGAAGSWMVSNLAPRAAKRDFAPGFMVKLQQKDLRLALEAAQENHLPLPGTALAQQLFRIVESTGEGNDGTQAIVKAIERLGNVQVGSADA